MTLPINTTPIYTLTIPSTGKQFKYRPFLVKDEKALLIAQQTEDDVVILDTVKQVILSCAKTPIDVDSLASFDIEYIFLQMRAVSVGEFVELVFACDTCESPDARSNVVVNLQQVKVERSESHTNKIELFGDVGVVLKYPTLETLKKIQAADSSTDLDDIFNIVTDCIDFIYSAEEVFAAKDQTQDELIEFLNNLTSEQFDKIQTFFQTMPKLKTYIDYKCPVCGKEHHKYMEGLASFF